MHLTPPQPFGLAAIVFVNRPARIHLLAFAGKERATFAGKARSVPFEGERGLTSRPFPTRPVPLSGGGQARGRRNVTTRTSRQAGRPGSNGATGVTPCATRLASAIAASKGSVSVN